jgi:hypothetical protein
MAAQPCGLTPALCGEIRRHRSRALRWIARSRLAGPGRPGRVPRGFGASGTPLRRGCVAATHQWTIRPDHGVSELALLVGAARQGNRGRRALRQVGLDRTWREEIDVLPLSACGSHRLLSVRLYVFTDKGKRQTGSVRLAVAEPPCQRTASVWAGFNTTVPYSTACPVHRRTSNQQ